MTNEWAQGENAHSDESIRILQAGLKVGMIATKRASFLTCAPSDSLAEVSERNTEPYDFIPVVAPGTDQIIGLFHAEAYVNVDQPTGKVADQFMSLREDLLIGSSSSILDFVLEADEKPCRLIVEGTESPVSSLIRIFSSCRYERRCLRW